MKILLKIIAIPFIIVLSVLVAFLYFIFCISEWICTAAAILLAGAKLPKMDSLKQERQRLAAEKRTAYREYRAAKNDMQELILVKANIDHLLGLTDAQKNKERER